MASTQADIDALQAVIGSGVLTVRYNDRQVTYQSTADMERTLARMKRELAAAAGASSTTRYVAIRKGR
jgi:hypothetical protein